MSAEPESDAWTDLEEALRAIRGVSCALTSMSANAAPDHLDRAVEYLGDRLNEHCDDARDAFDRLFALHHKRAEEARP